MADAACTPAGGERPRMKVSVNELSKGKRPPSRGLHDRGSWPPMPTLSLRNEKGTHGWCGISPFHANDQTPRQLCRVE